MKESSLIYDWNTVEYEFSRNPSNHPHGVWFDDETLRDGLQSPSARNPTIEQKIELLTFMEQLGLQKVDLGLPGAGPFTSVSYAVENDVPVMFVTEDTTRSNPEDVKMIYQRAMELGVRRLCVCDTCGHVTPNGVKKLLSFIDEEVIKDAGYQRREIEVNWHGHQDRGLGVANNIAAVEAGADVIHGTALGVGERAGNAPLDQTLVNLKLMGVIENDLTLLDAYMQKANEYIEVPLPRNYPVFGEDAFETGTGVHASAVIKAMRKGDHWLADRVYSGVPAGDFGLKQVIRIGHMSGRSNIVWWLEQNEIEVSDELVAHLFEIAKSQKRNMLDEEIHAAVSAFSSQ